MAKKTDRNAPCRCGSGKKYKHCCQQKDNAGVKSKTGMVILLVAVALGLLLAGLAISGGDDRQNCPPGTVWSDAHQHCH